MPNPWDVPPLPAKGDDTTDPIFRSIGMSLTSWEYVEHELAVIFGMFVGAEHPADEPQPHPAVRAYGSVVSFNGRADMLNEAAKAYFHRYSQDDLKSEFRGLLKECRGYAARRNDIAHGVVTLGWGTNPVKGHYLGPSSYTSRKNPIGGRPTYAYGSADIDAFRRGFEDLYDNLVDFQVRLSNRRPKQQS